MRGWASAARGRGTEDRRPGHHWPGLLYAAAGIAIAVLMIDGS
jgi:hypothetical protein